MNCDMCGSEGKLFKAIVEDAELNICHECSKFGRVIGVVKQDTKIDSRKLTESQTELMVIVVRDFGEKIRNKREDLGLKQEELAKKLNEKESLMQKIESGKFEPSIGLAKKIGSFLKIKLTEEYEEKHESRTKTKTNAFTIGDFIKEK